MGKILTDYAWDWERADEEFRRAIELKPNYPEAHHWYAVLLAGLGRFDEAVRAARRSLELDPLSPAANTQVGSTLYRARRYDEAITVLRRTLDLEPSFVSAHGYLGYCYIMQGRHDEAIAEFQKGHRAAPDSPGFISLLGYACGLAGRREEARRYLGELQVLQKRVYVQPPNYVLVYAGLGEMDACFEWLEKCFEERSSFIRGLNTEPTFDLMRDDPRFKALLRRAGF